MKIALGFTSVSFRSNHGLDGRPVESKGNRAFGYFCGATRLRSSAMRAPSSARELISSLR